MVLCNGWIETDKPEELTEDNICTYCQADEDECGEWRECCYSQAIKEAEAALKGENNGRTSKSNQANL